MLFLAVAGALLVPQSSGQDYERVVSFAHTAAPLKRVLPKLGQASGLTLTVSAQLENEVLLIEFDKKPISEALKNIATVTHAGWVRNGNSIELQRSPEVQEELERSFFQRKLQGWRRSLEEQLDYMGPPLDEARAEQLVKEAARISRLDEEEQFDQNTTLPLGLTPEDFLLARLASQLDLEALAAIPVGQTIVFATDPKYPERELPEGFGRLISQFVSEQRALSVAAGRLAFIGEPNEVKFPWLLFPDRPWSTFQECRLVVWCGPFELDLELDVKFVEGSSTRGMNLSIEEADKEEPPDVASRAPTQWKDVALSDMSRLELEWMRNPSRPPIEVTAEARRQALSPTAHDPLGFLISDSLRHVASVDGISLCALLPDIGAGLDGYSEYLYALLEYGSPSGFTQSYHLAAGVQVVDAEGWRVITPKDPVACESSRLPREVAELKIKASIEGGATIRDLSRVAKMQPLLAPDWSNISVWLTGHRANVFGEAWMSDDPEFAALRFLADLDDAAFDKLEAEGFLAVSELGQIGREALLQLMVDHGDRPHMDGKSAEDGSTGYRKLVDGNPDLTKVELLRKASWLIENRTETGILVACDIDMIARRLDSPRASEWSRRLRYRAAKTVEYALQVRFSDGSISSLAIEIMLPARLPENFVPVSELPKELLAKVEEERAKPKTLPP